MKILSVEHVYKQYVSTINEYIQNTFRDFFKTKSMEDLEFM